MTTIVTRTGKGSSLSWIEADANFTNLNTDKLEVSSNLSDVDNATTARTNLGLGNVDNTSDLNKPVSTATQTAIDASITTHVALADPHTQYMKEADLIASTGSTLVSTTQTGTGAVIRTVADKFKDFVSVKDFGAVGDGVTDDTEAIQAAILHGIETGQWLSGAGKRYACGGLLFTSGLKLRDISLVHNKNADLVSVLQTADTTLVSNVELENVNIDGSRETQTEIEGTTTREDGGRHCLAIRGECENIFIRNCTFTNSAADGLCLFPIGAAASYAVRNVVISDSVFTDNRRHGISADRVNGLTLVRCKLNSNGLTKNVGFPDNHGNTGDKLGGLFYGNGIDIEEYTSTDGSKNVWLIACEGTGNARGGVLILRTSDAMASTEFGFYHILGGSYNKGLYSSTNSSIEITPNTSAPIATMFHNVRVLYCDLGNGKCVVRAGVAEVMQVRTTASPAVQALELATVTTDSTSTYADTTGVLLQFASTPLDYHFTDTGMSRGATTIASYIDSVKTRQAVGDKYQFNVVDNANDIRGGFRLVQQGSGPMAFQAFGGIGGTTTNFFTARSTSLEPAMDNTVTLGFPSFRWSTVYAGTGTINTSDAREKQQISTLSDKETAVAKRLKSLVRTFKFNDAVNEKGGDARIHIGVIAQDVKAAFEAEGLVSENYAILCYDEWPEQQAVLNDVGEVIEPYRAAGNRYGVRYEELFAFIISAL